MAAGESDPLIETKPESNYINEQLSSEITPPAERERLKSDMNAFFEEEDAKAAAAPPDAPSAEPTAEPTQDPTSEPAPATPESKESAPAKTARAEKKSKPAKTAKEIEAEPDAEIDAFKLSPRASAEAHSQWHDLKRIAKEGKTEAKALRNGLTPVLREFGIEMNGHDIDSTMQEFAEKVRALKTTAIPQETQQELENLRTLARGVGILQSEEFTRDFVTPTNAAYRDVITEMSQYFDVDPAQVKADFTDPLLETGQFNPSNIPKEWWDEQIGLMKRAPEAIKTKIRQKVGNVLLLQERHDEAAKTLSTDPNSYAKWQQQQQQKQQEEFQRGWAVNTRDESEKALAEDEFKDLAEERTRLLAGSDEDKAVYAKAEQEANQFVNDVFQGPRTAVRRAMKFLQFKMRAEKLAGVEEDLKEANKEIKRLKGNVVSSRKAQDAPFKGGQGSGVTKPAAPGLPKDARKSLDDAFRAWKP